MEPSGIPASEDHPNAAALALFAALDEMFPPPRYLIEEQPPVPREASGAEERLARVRPALWGGA